MTRFAPRRLLFTLAVCFAVACTGGAGDGPAERIVVPAGAGFGQVADSLAAHDLLRSRLWFKLVARVKGVDRSVRAGVYEVPRGASTEEILAILAEGRAIAQRFTVPEGLTIVDVAALAEQRLGVPADSFLAAARDTALLDTLGITAASAEGFLYPDTYHLPVDATAAGIVRVMTTEFETKWDDRWTARLDSLGMSRLELVTLASIVEGEARVDAERETIAGVYHNRLRIGMALQADPTVQYAIQLQTGKRKPRLFEKDYRTPSPYNTYLNPGLPPGPVANPSRRSLQAALYPADVPYFFFVAGPDGRHTFTRTYGEHLRAVRQARAAMRAAARAPSADAPGN